MRLTTLIPALVLAVGVQAVEPAVTAPDPVRQEKAATLVKLMGLETQMREMAKAGLAESFKPLRAQMKGAQLEALEAAVLEINQMMADRLDWANVSAEAAQIYRDAYSAEELDQLIAFYGTPLGQKMMTSASDINRRVSALGSDRVRTLAPEMQKIFTKHMSKVRSLDKSEDEEAEALAKAGIVIGKPFPALEGTSTAGVAVSVAQLKGAVVLVDFWATWCGPCVGELPEVRKTYERFHDQGFEIIGVSLDEDLDALAKFVAEKKIAWPQLCDGKAWESPLAQRFGVRSIPATFLIGRDGTLLAIGARGEELTAAVEKAVANQAGEAAPATITP